MVLLPIHIAWADSTKLFCHVASVVWIRQLLRTCSYCCRHSSHRPTRRDSFVASVGWCELGISASELLLVPQPRPAFSTKPDYRVCSTVSLVPLKQHCDAIVVKLLLPRQKRHSSRQNFSAADVRLKTKLIYGLRKACQLCWRHDDTSHAQRCEYY